jgi:hypothetical protein
MSNTLRTVRAEVRKLSPAEAEVWVIVEAAEVTATTEVRGRLVGPRCPGATTVEVAYPLRPFPRLPDGLPPLSCRVVVPDPSLWAPEQPYTYRLLVELWQDGARCDQSVQEIGLGFRG